MKAPQKLRFRCASCSGKLEAHVSIAGAAANCTHCGAPLMIPLPQQPVVFSDAVTPLLVAVEMKLRCRGCGARLRIDARAAGKVVACPGCRARLAVPRLPPYSALIDGAESGAAAREIRPADALLSEEEIAFLTAPMEDAGPETEAADAVS
jgi:DNA-directed RNA polymerase subunit RPC12/RpoP